MVFYSFNKTVLYPKLHINAIEIERVDDFNFLGLQLNHNLKWNKHINYVSLKMSKITGLLHKLKSNDPISILKYIYIAYSTLILPNINYCILSWGSQIDKIHSIQKRELDLFQRVILERIRNHYLGNTICLKYKTYIIWLF